MRLEPMSEATFTEYRAGAEAEYAAEVAESGTMSAAEATEKAAADYQRLLPDGLRTPDQHLLAAVTDDGVEVGVLWLHVSGGKAFVYEIKVRPEHRRSGHGRAIMLAGEEYARARGVTSIGLNVWGANTVARSLYESLGYRTTSVAMRKEI